MRSTPLFLLLLPLLPGPASGAPAGLGDERVVLARYRAWNASAPDDLVLGLGWSKSLSVESSRARGVVRIDEDGSVAVEVNGLGPGEWQAWVVANVPGPKRSAVPEAGDETIAIGPLEEIAGVRTVTGRLGPGFASRIDAAVVTRTGSRPEDGGVLFGFPTLFQRLARGSQRQSLGDLVMQGETLFFEETFDGNGRTCGSCHPAENNFTIDPEWIATLPPNDPLFVAEFVPALAQHFENPTLMRGFGLVLENVDGFGDLANRFTMRGVPHTLAQGLSIAPADFDSSGGGTVPPFERTGWSGDGAPGGGTLREFPLGAIPQHFTNTLARQAPDDFRLPSDEELDAIEAFTLSLGRRSELDLGSLHLADPVDRAGLALFTGTKKCFECHADAGANAGFIDPFGTKNLNFDTGAEDVKHPADGTGEPRPRDGGFGQDPHPLGGFGDGRFNTASLVEAADTPPFFHNNAFETLEDAVAFYSSDEFNASPGGIFVDGLDLTDDEVRKISAFLRVINALENVRGARDLADRARAPGSSFARLLSVAGADVEDAIEVLTEASLHGVAMPHLQEASMLAAVAAITADDQERGMVIDEIDEELERARRRIQHLGSWDPPDPGSVLPEASSTTIRVLPDPGSAPHAFSFTVSRAGPVVVSVIDILGRRVATPLNATLPTGTHVAHWNGRSENGSRVATGVLFVRVQTRDGARTGRFVHLAR